MNTRFDLTHVEQTNPVEFRFPISESTTKIITVKFKPNNVASSIQKSGSADKTLNPEKITWTIDVNKKLESISQAVVTDTLGEGLLFDPDPASVAQSVYKVYKLNVGLDGSVSQGAEIPYSDYAVSAVNPATRSFTMNFGSITEARRIVYETKITDNARTSFTNTAAFKGSSSTATVNATRSFLEKAGHPDREFNPDTVTWAVYANKSRANLTNARIQDTIPVGLALEPASIKVYELDILPDGTTVSGAVYSDAVINVSGNTFTVGLGDIDRAYGIEYVTTNGTRDTGDIVTKTFSNSARLFSSNNASPLATASKTVSFKVGSLVYKKGNASIGYNDKHIDWTIDVNTAQKTIINASVTDEVYAGHKLSGAVAVYSLNFNSSGEVAGEVIDPSKTVAYFPDSVNPASFTVSLGDITGAYRIKYRTQITDVNKNGGTGFLNKAKLEGNDTGGPIGIPQSVTINPSISNSVGKSTVSNGVNYTDKTMDWRITVNPQKETVKNLVVTDTFTSKGLKLKRETLTVKRGSATVAESVYYNVYKLDDLDADWEEGFRIQFLEDVKDAQYTISYKTDFDRLIHTNPDDAEIYLNTARFDWDETITGHKSQTRTAQYDVRNSETKDPAVNNGSKWGTLRREAREIDWIVNLNYLSENFNSLVVEDDILGNQDLVLDSLKIYSYTVDAAGNIVLGGGVTGGYAVEKDEKKFRVTFDGAVSTPYRIAYTTKITGQSQTQYENTALVNGTSLNASVVFPDSDVFVDKRSTYTGGYTADWEIDVNKSLSPIHNAVLTDTLSPGHEYIPDSVKVYRMPGNVELDADKYQVTLKILDFATNQQGFELKFLEPVTSEYVVKYQTEITAGNNQSLTNTAVLSGEGVEIRNDQQTETIVSSVTGGSGTGQGRIGRLTVRKVDGDDPGIKLSGVVFELLDSQKNLIGTLPATDGDGEVIVNRLNYGTYYIREKSTVSGYQLNEDDIAVSMTSSNTDAVIVVPNQKIKSRLIVHKADVDTNAGLSGAEFEIRDSLGNLIGTVTTDDQGKAEISGLTFGDYALTETAAPYGYKLPEGEAAKTDFTIDSAADKTVTVENDKIRSKLIIEKLDGDTNAVLSGAEFEIRDSFGNLIGTVTTDDQGKAEVSGLTFGNYTLTETAAPDRYKLPDGEASRTDFTIDSAAGKTVTVENDKIRSKLIIEKLDGDTNAVLSGAEFEIRDSLGSLIGTVTTDDQGKAEISGLTFGSYTLTETVASYGYKLPEGEAAKTDFTIDSAADKTVIVENQKIRSKLIIEKVDGDTNAGLSGAQFELRDASGSQIGGIITTDDQGKAEIGGLAFGNYILTETAAPYGYKLPEGETAETSFTVDSAADKTVRVENQKIRSKLIIQKVDGDSNIGLSGAEFELRDSLGNWIGTAITDDQGKAEINGLTFGDYILTETAVPYGYQLPEGEAAETGVTIGSADDKIVRVENHKIKSKLIIEKVDSDTNARLSGAQFELRDASGSQIGGTITTDADGRAEISGLAFGTYTLTETEAPYGYEPTVLERIVVIDSAGDRTVIVQNRRLKFTIAIEKVDSSNAGIKLSGAQFEIKDALGNFVGTAVTDSIGKASIGNLFAGRYTITETKAPEGYTLNSNPKSIEISKISASGLVYDLMVSNIRRSSGGGGGTSNPGTPGQPESPGSPGSPEEPGTPGQPEDPEEPETPEQPENPGTPEEPGTPEQPEDPGNPEEPGTPEEPEQPETPAELETPGQTETTVENTPVDGIIEVPDGEIPSVGQPPKNGEVTIDEDGKWTYTPDPDFKGKDSFTIKVKGPDGKETEQLIEIEVNELPRGAAKLLPKTGEGSRLGFYIGGLVLLFAGLWLRRKKTT